MMVIFGGRTNGQTALNDTWGLRRHRDATWEWVKAPCKSNTEEPVGVFRHQAIFIGAYMIVLGGRTS